MESPVDSLAASSLPPSLTDFAVDRIRSAIVAGSLRLGQQISEAALAQSMGISKTPVREALVRLQRQGLVEIHPRKGTFVFMMTPRELAEICDCRTIVETAALRLSMERDRAALVATLADVAARMEKAWSRGDERSYRLLDTQFHLAFLDHCGNRYLQQAYELVSSKMAALRNRLSAHADHMRKSYDEHVEMARLLATGDAEAAIHILEGHIGRRQGSYWMTSEALA